MTHRYGSGHGPGCAVLCDANHGTDPRLFGPARPVTLTFTTDVPGGRDAALDLRDEIIEALKPLGVRLSLIDCGTSVYLAAPGAPTVADTITALAAQLDAGGCGCECCTGGFCGGCGYAGCGGRVTHP